MDPSSPPMAPTVTPASSSPIVAVSMPSSVLMAGSRGPQAESAIPPRANAAVIAQRQRASVRPSAAGTGLPSTVPPFKNLPLEGITPADTSQSR